MVPSSVSRPIDPIRFPGAAEFAFGEPSGINCQLKIASPSSETPAVPLADLAAHRAPYHAVFIFGHFFL
jgi:hypothetical protein